MWKYTKFISLNPTQSNLYPILSLLLVTLMLFQSHSLSDRHLLKSRSAFCFFQSVRLHLLVLINRWILIRMMKTRTWRTEGPEKANKWTFVEKELSCSVSQLTFCCLILSVLMLHNYTIKSTFYFILFVFWDNLRCFPWTSECTLMRCDDKFIKN